MPSTWEHPDNYTRFPEAGFITGDVRNLVEFIRPAAEPADLIHQAADTLAKGAEIAAGAIVQAAALTPSNRGSGDRRQHSRETSSALADDRKRGRPYTGQSRPRSASTNRQHGYSGP